MGNEYWFRKIDRNTIEIAKFDGKGPVTIYRAYVDGKNVKKCSCPGFTGHTTCKHIPMMQEWINKGEPIEVPTELPRF